MANMSCLSPSPFDIFSNFIVHFKREGIAQEHYPLMTQ